MSSTVNGPNSGVMNVAPVTTNNIELYTFYVYASNGWGSELYTALVTVKIVCTPSSVTISAGSFAGSLIGIQTVQANDDGIGLGLQGTRFIHPSITLSNNDCPITAIRIVSTHDDSLPAYNTPDPLFSSTTTCADFA